MNLHELARMWLSQPLQHAIIVRNIQKQFKGAN